MSEVLDAIKSDWKMFLVGIVLMVIVAWSLSIIIGEPPSIPDWINNIFYCTAKG